MNPAGFKKSILFLSALSVASILLGSRAAYSQTETPPPAPATDEYGIPLKLQSPKKTSADPAQTTSTIKTDAYGMPLSHGASMPGTAKSSARVSRARKKSEDGLTSSGASGKLVRTKVKPKKSSSPIPQVVAPEVLETQADQELVLKKGELSTGVLPTPATVRSRVEEVKNPVKPLLYRLGVSVQPFQPKGSLQVGDLVPYDTSALGTNAMFALEGQWLPLKFVNTPGLDAGGFISVGYAQFNVALRSPAGISLENTRLNVIKIQGGATVSYQLPKSPLWSVHGNVGLGRLLEIQSSGAQYANTSTAVNFVSLGGAGERSLLPNLSAYAAYDFRLALDRSTSGADVPMHNVLVGFLGNFE